MFTSFGIKDDFMINQTGFRKSSTSDVTSATVEKESILPDININDKKMCKNSFSLKHPKSSKEECILKLPRVDGQRENLPSIQDEKDGREAMFSNANIDGRSTNLQYQKFKLEDSVKKSLENYYQPKFYIEGESKSTHHLILEMNEFYLEMAEQLRFLKGEKIGENVEDHRLEGNPSSYQIELDKLISSIEEDDQKVAENMKALKEVKEERNIIHQEIQTLSGESDKTKPTKEDEGQNMITYLFTSNDVDPANCNNVVEQNEKDANNKKKNVQPEGRNFIAKNKELAKEYKMSRYCLTDEEKRKLQLLLFDIDICEEKCEEIEKCINQAESCLEETSEVKETEENEHAGEHGSQNWEDDRSYNSNMCINGFKLDDRETESLSDLDLKLTYLKADDSNEEIKQTSETDDYKKLEAAETKGKRWKFQLLQKRLKNIDKGLSVIYLEKDKEMASKNMEELENEIIVDTADIKEEYKKSVYDMSVDIAELEYREERQLEELDNDYEMCKTFINA